MTQCPKPLEIVTYFLDGGSPNSLIANHADGCAACSDQLRELESERRAFLTQHPFSSFFADLENRRSPKVGPVGPKMRRLSAFLKRMTAFGALRAVVAMASVATLMIVVIDQYDR